MSIRDQRRKLEAIVKDLEEKEAQAEETLWNMLMGMNLKNIKSEVYGTVSRRINTQPYVANEEAFAMWCRATNNVHLLQDKVRMRALREYIEEREKAKDPEPNPPGVEIIYKHIISIRGGTYDG